MPGYDDDLDGRDEFEDRDDFDRGGDRIISRAKNGIRGPAIGLLISGILGLLFSAYMLVAVNHPSFDVGYDAQIQVQMNDPNKTAAEKKQLKEMMEDYREPLKEVTLFWSAISTAVNLLILLSSLMMLSLKARGLSYFASILAMIPVTNCFCVLGLPFGIWALIALGKPEVKAGYAAAARQ